MIGRLVTRIRLSPTVERLRRSPLRKVVNAWRYRGLTDADVLLASFPRSGNTWAKCMLAELLSGREVGEDYGDDVIPIIGQQRHAERVLPGGGRVIKTHEAAGKGRVKAIYIVRDVRDVVPSYHRLGSATGLPTVPFNEFLHGFVRGDEGGFGSWQDHVDSWLDAADRGSEIMLVRYEDLVNDPTTELGRMADFLGVPATQERLEEVVQHNEADRMRGRTGSLSKSVASVVVKNATYGAWRDVYTDDELAILAPTAPAMRRLGYEVTDDLRDAD